MQLSLQDLNAHFDAKTASRGKSYFLAKNIFDFSYDTFGENSAMIHSKSRGSYHNHYSQEITLSHSPFGIEIMGMCGCPMASHCKHIYASLMVYIQTIKKNDPIHDATKWIETLVRTSNQKRVSNYSNNDFFLIYRVFSDDENSYYREDIKFFKTKYLKNGAIGKGTHISSDNLLYGYSYEDIKTEEDEAVLDLCKGIIPRFSTTSSEIHGKLGSLLLQELIQTKRCFYKDNKKPLVMSQEVFTIDFFWESVDEKHSKISSNIDENLRVIETEPFMVLDKVHNTLYRTQTCLPKNIIELLRSAPKLPNALLTTTYKTLLDIPSLKEAIPAPKTVKTEEVKEQAIPYLKIHKEIEEEKEFYGMRLYFKYGNYFFNPYPQKKISKFFETDTEVSVFRDLDKENESLKELTSKGFIEAKGRGYRYLKAQGENTQNALKMWHEFLEIDVERLKKCGWEIEFVKEFSISFDESSLVEVDTHEESNGWFELSFNVEVAGQKRSLVDLVAPILKEFNNFDSLPQTLFIETEEDSFVTIAKKELEPVLKTIMQLFHKKEDKDKILIAPYEAHLLNVDDSIWKGDKDLLALSKKLQNFTHIQEITPPKTFTGKLREYQQQGFNWLQFLYEFRFGGILADDMGLGKTIQTLVHLAKLKEEQKLTHPALIIVPTSLIANWKNEAKEFTPDLKVLTLYGQERSDLFSQIEKSDIVITTYSLVVNDLKTLLAHTFLYIILDEAQKIKNHKTKAHKSISSLKATHKLALSGTPVENHLGELWSIFSFLMSGFLGTETFFKTYYQTPIEKERDLVRKEELHKRVKPFIIRRTKEKVAKELPKKSEIIKYTQFSDQQAKLYETIRITMEKKVKDAISKQGLDRSHITILDALLKLRQVCCDPSILKIKEAQKVKESAKMELLMDLLEELLQEERKILLFSQFTSVLDLIEKKLLKKSISYTKLTGSSTNREKIIEKFKKDDVSVFLISLKAGGVGLNLVEADTVIHYDPWWNPAVENQATDRAYRIGQEKSVFVYKLIVENSIEEKIIELQKKKQSLQNGIYQKSDTDEDEQLFNKQELINLLKG